MFIDVSFSVSLGDKNEDGTRLVSGSLFRAFCDPSVVSYVDNSISADTTGNTVLDASASALAKDGVQPTLCATSKPTSTKNQNVLYSAIKIPKKNGYVMIQVMTTKEYSLASVQKSLITDVTNSLFRAFNDSPVV